MRLVCPVLSSFASFAAIVLISAPAFAQTKPDAPAAVTLPALTDRIPVDAKVKIGTLPNGLRYYIRQNPKPEKRAELRLVVNAGSILETEKQLGYAHFVEHTAFNGTKHFAKNDLVSYLNSVGVRLGADLNAQTGFDMTTYILPVPTDTPRIVEQAFTILEDWAHGQIFDSAEVIGERGVVREEWRGRKGANDRMLQQFLPIAFKGSLYAERLPIGTEESIMSATPSSLRAFYREWYRPELMAVIAVGDFNPAAIEAQIKRHFSSIPRRPNAKKRTYAAVPDNKAPLIAIASDKEATGTNVGLFFKRPATVSRTVGDYREDLVGDLYIQMLNSRLNEITQRPDAPFTAAGASKGGFLTNKIDPFSLGANVKDGGVERGLEALLLEAKRVDQFGFLQSELDRAKTNTLRGYEVANAEREKTESYEYADEYIRNYLDEEPIPGIAYEYGLVQKLLPSITLADVNKSASSWITEENRVVIVRAPVKDSVPIPTESSILAVFGRAASAPVTAYTETLSGDALIDVMPQPGTVVGTRSLGVGVFEWKLSNGARVLVKPTDFKADEILFEAFSPGGTGTVADADYMSASYAAQVVGLSGLGKFNRVDLGKKLAGKNARVSATLGEISEGLRGSASPKDLETMLQLAHLHFTGARLDTTAFQAFKNNMTPALANRGASPDAALLDTFQLTMGQYSVRSRPLSLATLAEINPEKAVGFFKDRFADAGDFTFLFVGTIDTTALKPLVERYLASLPSRARKDTPKVASFGPPKGVIEKTVRKGVEPKATTLLIFTGPCAYSPETRVAMRGMVEAFQLRLLESLREKLGGTYSPSVQGGCSRIPREEYLILVFYGSSPENVETLSQAVFALVDTLQTKGPTAADVEKTKEQIIRAREVDVKQNPYWLSSISQRDQAGEPIPGILEPYDELVKKITAAQIQEAAKQYLNKANVARFVLLPESK